ncbi:MAG TPA: hypothetical protein VIK78_10590, partial [Ruminiclostridium sp.]
MLKKIITFMMIAVLLLSTFSYAATTTQTQSTWKDSLANLKLMGVVNESDLNMSGNITRAVFS